MCVRAGIGGILVLLALGVAACGDGSSDADARIRATKPVTLVAAGDIACHADEPRTAQTCRQADVADIIERLDPDVVAPLGDTQYPDGELEDFEESYDPTWGRFMERTRPAVGNHEYNTPGAAGYYEYFGRRAGSPDEGWYSYELGDWHVVVLNTNCDVIDCEPDSEQQRWLEDDLAEHDARCTLAYWHHPRFSSGPHGSDDIFEPLWETLQEADAELVLSGHDHAYERFAPQDADGELDREDGIPQFVVGTGGASRYPAEEREPNSLVHSTSFGVLELTLDADGYAWRFVGEPGDDFRDAGRTRCR
ncbi:MAG TPA: metallophosphoesterase [Conexibacter sp.]|nr:metallophosphoesterase [Conexibacter sp.]